jgi:hypothetical protein
VTRSLSAAASATAVLLSLSIAAAQPLVPTAYLRADFIKVKPGKLPDYEAFLKKNIPAITDAGIKAGKLTSTGYADVITPTGTAEEHDLLVF